MTKTTILDKLNIVIEISKTSKLFIVAIIFILLLSIVALTTKKENAKRGKIIYSILYSIITIFIIAKYHASLGKMFDYMMNNLFIVITFPNIAVYIAAIIITNIILCISVFSLKTTRLIKTLNTVIHGIIHYLLVIVLSLIVKNNLDIFSQLSLYSNKEVQAIIELSSGIFILWIIFLTIYKVIRNYQLKQVQEQEIEVIEKVVVKEVKKLPESIREIPVPLYVKAQSRKNEDIEVLDTPIIVGTLVKDYEEEKKLLETELKELKQKLETAEAKIKIQEEVNIKLEEETEKLKQETKTSEPISATTAFMQNLDGMLTLEDYKILSTILKDKQKKRNEIKALEKQRNEEQLKFSQLREAYKSVR